VSEQLSMGLGLPDPPQPLAHGTTLFSGCRVHSCDEKAAIVAAHDGTALAFSLIYFPCDNQRAKAGAMREICANKPRQKIFLKRRSVDVERSLEGWGQRVSGPISVEVSVIR
jgi:hypothetical protein